MGELCLRCPGRMEIISCSTELPGSIYAQIFAASSQLLSLAIVSLQTYGAFAHVYLPTLITKL